MCKVSTDYNYFQNLIYDTITAYIAGYIIVYLFTPTLQVILTQHTLMTNNYTSYKRKNNSCY